MNSMIVAGRLGAGASAEVWPSIRALAGVHRAAAGPAVAAVAWLAGPLGLIVINRFSIRIDPKITFSHSIAYLVRFAISVTAAELAFSNA